MDSRYFPTGTVFYELPGGNTLTLLHQRAVRSNRLTRAWAVTEIGPNDVTVQRRTYDKLADAVAWIESVHGEEVTT